MPRAAVELGAAEEVLHVDQIAQGIARMIRQPGRSETPSARSRA
jgi:chemotaxis response regulator CheB